jgi:hypothetical protein
MARLAELEADTHLHVHKENIHLFPAVTAMEERLMVVVVGGGATLKGGP